MADSIAAQPYAFQMNDDLTFKLHINVGFVVSGTATNFSFTIDVTPPMPLTSALFNLQIQTAVKDYANANYSTSFLASDVVLLGGVTTI